MVSLCELKPGQEAEISNFTDSSVKCNSQRFGLFEGGKIKCIAKPGPVIVGIGKQIIAIGNNLSKKIFVTVCENKR
ncbi:MAG TPA: ferrous iron transport protein A [Candidatus Gastranaerophilales bacterium]|nr:ferrous iron transport protein A [Candidatus Gastranaerophilales bacterium]